MPYVDRQNRVCGFLDIEEKEGSSRFQRRYFILDTQGNTLLWYMDNPQNLPSGANAVGSLQLTYISKVSEATGKQKPKTEFCFVINAVSRRYFLQANDAADLRDWVIALNKATKITVPKAGPLQPRTEVSMVTGEAGGKRQAYKTEIIGGVVVHTPMYQNEGEEMEVGDRKVNAVGSRPGVLRCGYCVKQGNMTDTPEDMQGWIRDIEGKIQDFRGPGKSSAFTRASSLYCHGNSSHQPSVLRGRQGDDKRPPLVKSCSVAPGWQPWTPVPQREAPALGILDKDGPFSSLLPSLSSLSLSTSSSLSSLPTPTPQGVSAPASGVGVSVSPGPIAPGPSSSRRRHRSQPQPTTDRSFPFSLDHDGIRTTDV
ncbi:pleckstrin homology domain-containing family A member 2-like isoform X2 [Salvelinus namaycush]|uniref:Pleckstrin homology domain-containing family A member 2-like isoform X2 n=1 Tax=Salvelinus namaycush TaxID=8040 RepID=A0A8U1F4V3_SALNM|nr:pleckstrin homology domain-containing family A member 2-like isoform X2 [Salvelinus namaycush]